MNSIYGNIDDLYLFFCVVEEGSLLAASKKLKLPPSTMSRRLSALESRLNLRLLEKKGRELVATQSGKETFQVIRSGMENIESSFGQVMTHSEEVAGNIRLAIPHNFYRAYVGSVVEDFISKYPKVNIELALSQEYITPETNRDLLMTFDLSGLEGMVARPLFQAQHGFFASPDYLKKVGPVETLEQLAQLDWLASDRQKEVPIYQRDEFVQVLKVKPKLIINDINAIAGAVVRGLGVASLPLRHISKEMKVEPVLPQYHRSDRQAYLVYKERKYQPRALTLLVDVLLEASQMLRNGTPVVKGD